MRGLFLVMSLVFTACSSDTDELDLLDESSKSGITFEAKLNGDSFIANDVKLSIKDNIIHLIAKNSDSDQSIFLTIDTSTGNEVKLGTSLDNPNNNVAGYLVNSKGYMTSNVNATTGEVNFTTNDIKSELFEATFFFAASDVDDNYISITQGKFKKD